MLMKLSSMIQWTKKKSEELISCIEMFEDPEPTAETNHQPEIPESASVDIKIAASVDF